MAGAASHIDLFDYKPELVKRHGQPSDFGEAVEAFQDGLGPWMKPVWPFRPYGQSGKMLGDVVSDLGQVVDEMLRHFGNLCSQLACGRYEYRTHLHKCVRCV